MRIQLSTEEAGNLRKPVNGQGGWQNYLRKLQAQLADDNALTLHEEDAERLIRYLVSQGGFQDRLAPVFERMGEK